jgi:hypothetical protein
MPRPGDRWIASSLALLAMTAEVSRFNCQTACGCESAFPRRGSRPSFMLLSALKQRRAQGRPGARCTRGPVCIAHRKSRTRAYRFSGNTPAFPAQWLYGLLRALPGERLCCHRRRARMSLRNLTPAPRRQDHTTSPYASCALVFCAIRVHRIPPRVRDVRTPLVRVRRAELNH